MIVYIGNLRNKTLPHLEYSVQSLNACALINLDYISQRMLMKRCTCGTFIHAAIL